MILGTPADLHSGEKAKADYASLNLSHEVGDSVPEMTTHVHLPHATPTLLKAKTGTDPILLLRLLGGLERVPKQVSIGG